MDTLTFKDGTESEATGNAGGQAGIWLASLVTILFGPVVVAAAQQAGTGEFGTAQQVDLAKEASKQGALFLLLVVLGFFYRRDFLAKINNSQAQVSALLHVVQSNITAFQDVKTQLAAVTREQERVARALEAKEKAAQQ